MKKITRSINNGEEILWEGVGNNTGIDLHEVMKLDPLSLQERKQEKESQDKLMNLYHIYQDNFLNELLSDDWWNENIDMYSIVNSSFTKEGMNRDVLANTLCEKWYITTSQDVYQLLDKNPNDIDMSWREIFTTIRGQFTLYNKMEYVDVWEYPYSSALSFMMKTYTRAAPFQLVISHQGKNIAWIGVRSKISAYFWDIDDKNMSYEKIFNCPNDLWAERILEKDLVYIMKMVEVRELKNGYKKEENVINT